MRRLYLGSRQPPVGSTQAPRAHACWRCLPTSPSLAPAPSVCSHLLKLTLHDWPDADCLRILAAVRAAQAATASKQGSRADKRLLVVDMVLPDRGPLGVCAASSDLQVGHWV